MDNSESEMPNSLIPNADESASRVESPWMASPGDIGSEPSPTRRLGIDSIALAIVLWFAANLVGELASFGIEPRLRRTFLASSIANCLIFLALPRLLQLASATSPESLGLGGAHPLRSVGQGLLLAAFWGPPTFWLNAAVRFYVPQTMPHPGETFLRANHSAGEWLIFLFALCVAAPLAEELLFRGVLLGWLSEKMGSAEAIVVSGILFAMAHTNWPDQLPLAFLGVGLGLAYRRTASIWAPIAMHCAFNLSNVAIAFFASTR